jgi:competence transcription factor ComK
LWVHYNTSCNTQSNAPEDGQNNCPKHVELTGITNKPLLLHLVDCLYYLYQCCTVKQISDNEIYLLIKYIKSILWRVVKCLSYIEEARCLKIKYRTMV